MAYDVLIVGAGYAGAVAARRLAEDGGKKVLVLERRHHVAGNAYDGRNWSGIWIHFYGPHIFHTNDKRVYDYLSRFTQWHEYEHTVTAGAVGSSSPYPSTWTPWRSLSALRRGRNWGISSSPPTGRRRR